MDKKRIGEIVIGNLLFNDKNGYDNSVLLDILIQSLPCGYHTESGYNVLNKEFEAEFIKELRNEY